MNGLAQDNRNAVSIAVLALVLCLLPGLLKAGPHDRDYYLYQAFQSGTPGQRIALNHLGIVPERVGEHWYVGAVMQGYPAHQAGLRRGDIVHNLDGQPWHPVHTLNPDTFIVAPAAVTPSTVTLEYERNGQHHLITLRPVRENLYDSTRSATDASINRFITGNKAVTYIHLWSLSRSPADLHYYRYLFNDVFRGSDALIIDLRHAYGYLDPQHAHPFFASRRQGPGEAIRQFEGPVVIISNSQTRGGPEMLMHQLSASPRILLVGENTANVAVDHQQAYPLLPSSGIDPQFEAALNLLLNVL